MSRFIILFLIFLLGAAITVSAEDGFFDGFGEFLDDIGDYIENIDLSSYIPDTSDKRGTTYYYYPSFLDTYLHVRLIDTLFPPKPSYSTPPTLADIVLRKSLFAVSCIGLSLIVIFIILDLIRHRSLRGNCIINMIILWGLALLSCFGVYILYHLVKILIAFFPHFWPYFLGVIGVLLVIYVVIRLYKKSAIRIVRDTHHRSVRNS